MARRRFFVPEVQVESARIEGDEARHLTQVLRVEAGQIFELSDNHAVYLAEISSARKSQVDFRILKRLPDPKPGIPIHLLTALIKFDHLELMLEKATELGVTSVHFVRAERSDKGLDKAAEKRIERWRRIVTEASQQSRRLKLPELHGPVRYRDAVQFPATQRFFLDEAREGAALLSAIDTSSDSIALLIGPEGGWPEHEKEAALESGWTNVSMGEQILRTETAAIAALAVINAALQR